MDLQQRTAFSPMEPSPASCPGWLASHLQQAGGVVSFRRFMDLALNDPENGYYGSGHGRIGIRGDYVTSPSLGPDFAALLADQLALWLREFPSDGLLSLVEVGPGEGEMAADLIASLATLIPDRLQQMELVLVELNDAMRERQRQRLAEVRDLPIRWSSLQELRESPVCGVVLAHELLDALPVDRLTWRNGSLQLQGVALNDSGTLELVQLPLSPSLSDEIEAISGHAGVDLPPDGSPEGWTSEWHSAQFSWLQTMRTGLQEGLLLVIDYAMEARRYYSNQRIDGTLLCISNQQAHGDPLSMVGRQDLTAHLCLETMHAAADAADWRLLSDGRQGEILLGLGLAQRLHGLQMLPPDRLSEGLRRREAMLRLVDPAGLGEFRWLLYSAGLDPDRFSFSVPQGSAESPLG